MDLSLGNSVDALIYNNCGEINHLICGTSNCMGRLSKSLSNIKFLYLFFNPFL